MSKMTIQKRILLALVLLGLTAWLLSQRAVAEQNKAVATFVTQIHPDLVAPAESAPQVHLEMPASAQVGDWVTAWLVATDVENLAGFQVALHFDAAALGLGTAKPVTGFAAARDLLSLGYVRQEQGLLLAAATCPVADCTSAVYQQDPQLAVGASGTVTLATFEFQVRQGGMITIEVADIILVDTQGHPLLTGSQYPSPTVSQPTLETVDLSGNKQINDADAYLVVSAWRELQRTGRCLATPVTAYDVDGNGCLNVADVQAILSAWGESLMPTPASLPDGHSPQATFTVNSSGDQSDTNPGNGTCLTSLLNCTLRAAIQ